MSCLDQNISMVVTMFQTTFMPLKALFLWLQKYSLNSEDCQINIGEIGAS